MHKTLYTLQITEMAIVHIFDVISDTFKVLGLYGCGNNAQR
jgi:hypothetical protein